MEESQREGGWSSESQLPSHALRQQKRGRILQGANEARFAELLPAQIAPVPVGEGLMSLANPLSAAYLERVDRFALEDEPQAHSGCGRRQRPL